MPNDLQSAPERSIDPRTPAGAASLISLRRVTKEFVTPAGVFTALSDVTLGIEQGQFVAVVGESGSGKSTLLSLIAGIDRPTHGEVHVGRSAVHDLRERELSPWRGRAVGIVFQFFQLLPTLTALENVMLPMDFCNRWPRNERRARAEALLSRVGVTDQRDKLPVAMSGGQQQRVAIARAMANAPSVLLADEPTGNLDSKTSEAILDIFGAMASEGETIVMVTHEERARRHASRIIHLADGRILTGA